MQCLTLFRFYTIFKAIPKIAQNNRRVDTRRFEQPKSLAVSSSVIFYSTILILCSQAKRPLFVSIYTSLVCEQNVYQGILFGLCANGGYFYQRLKFYIYNSVYKHLFGRLEDTSTASSILIIYHCDRRVAYNIHFIAEIPTQ